MFTGDNNRIKLFVFANRARVVEKHRVAEPLNLSFLAADRKPEVSGDALYENVLRCRCDARAPADVFKAPFYILLLGRCEGVVLPAVVRVELFCRCFVR